MNSAVAIVLQLFTVYYLRIIISLILLAKLFAAFLKYLRLKDKNGADIRSILKKSN